MALLFMVGEGFEGPESVTALLDIENMPAKPHYKMAPELPLVLHECGFDSMRIHLQAPVLWSLTGHYEALWEKHTIAACRAKNALESLKSWEVRRSDVDTFVSYITGKKQAISDRKSGWKKDKNKTDEDKNQKSEPLLLSPGDVECRTIIYPLNVLPQHGTAPCVESTDIMDTEIAEGGTETAGTATGTGTGAGSSVWSDATQVAWREVLCLLLSRHGLTPIDPLLPHVPLLQVLQCVAFLKMSRAIPVFESEMT